MVAVPEALVREARTALSSDSLAPLLVEPGAPAVHVVPGGADRIESVDRALRAVPDCEYVLVHDAARCLTPPHVFRAVVSALAAGAEAVVPVVPVTDTVRRVDGSGALHGGLDRSALRRIQTPQGFPRSVLVRAHERQRAEPDPAATDDAGLVERLGLSVRAVTGSEQALKITHPIDLGVAGLYLTGTAPKEETR